MHKIFLPIDTKSLYLNIRNDNLKGHTCTVATPIKQGHSINEQLNEIYKIPKQESQYVCDQLSDELNKNSKSTDQINNIFVFDKLMVNGQIINTPYKYCMFIKEEIDPDKYQFGRTKLHYPISLKIPELDVNNKAVLKEISSMYHDYAFLIEGFEYDFDTDYLNFNLLIVGYHDIPYSKVFFNYKGDAHNKLNSSIKNYVDIYDVEIESLKRLYGEEISVNNFDDYMFAAYKTATDLVVSYLENNGASEIRIVSSFYPYSLFDVQYTLNGQIYYGIISATYSNVSYFNLSVYQFNFVNHFLNTSIFIVRNVGNKSMIKISEYKSSNIDFFNQYSNSIRFVIMEG